jgi:hypothetical protein
VTGGDGTDSPAELTCWEAWVRCAGALGGRWTITLRSYTRRMRTRRAGTGAAAWARSAGSRPVATRVASSASRARKIAADAQRTPSAPRLRRSPAGARSVSRSVIAGGPSCQCSACAGDDHRPRRGWVFRGCCRHCGGTRCAYPTGARYHTASAGSHEADHGACARMQGGLGAGFQTRHHQRKEHHEGGQRHHREREGGQKRMGFARPHRPLRASPILTVRGDPRPHHSAWQSSGPLSPVNHCARHRRRRHHRSRWNGSLRGARSLEPDLWRQPHCCEFLQCGNPGCRLGWSPVSLSSRCCEYARRVLRTPPARPRRSHLNVSVSQWAPRRSALARAIRKSPRRRCRRRGEGAHAGRR